MKLFLSRLCHSKSEIHLKNLLNRKLAWKEIKSKDFFRNHYCVIILNQNILFKLTKKLKYISELFLISENISLIPSKFQLQQLGSLKIITVVYTKVKFSNTNFLSQCGLIRRKSKICSHLQQKSLRENWVFCPVSTLTV